VALASTGNFSKAAALRHVTQPAFSRRIRALEHWVGAALVDRSAYPTKLTLAGEKFHDTAVAVAAELHRSRADLQAEAQADQEVIRFAALHTLALTFFPAWFSSLQRGEAIRSSLVADNLHDCVEMLASGQCDLLLSYAHARAPVRIDAERFESRLLSAEELAPVVGKSAPEAWRLPGAAPIPYLRYSAETLLGRLVDLVLADNPGAVLEARYENSMAEALKAMVLQGAGLAWLPTSTIGKELDSGDLVLAGDERWRIGMEVRLYRRKGAARRAVERLWKRVGEA
jgi:DNA-binding transcriptional LysR family regulator